MDRGFRRHAVGGVHGPGVPNITAEAYSDSTSSGSQQWGESVNTVLGAFSPSTMWQHKGVADGTATVYGLKNLKIDASYSSGAYGAGGAQRVRPRAFGALACVYLGA